MRRTFSRTKVRYMLANVLIDADYNFSGYGKIQVDGGSSEAGGGGSGGRISMLISHMNSYAGFFRSIGGQGKPGMYALYIIYLFINNTLPDIYLYVIILFKEYIFLYIYIYIGPLVNTINSLYQIIIEFNRFNKLNFLNF